MLASTIDTTRSIGRTSSRRASSTSTATISSGDRGQTVRARQIDEFEAVAGVRQLADFFLDRDAGIIADALTDAGQGTEQRRLARVGVADQGDANRTGGSGRHENCVALVGDSQTPAGCYRTWVDGVAPAATARH